MLINFELWNEKKKLIYKQNKATNVSYKFYNIARKIQNSTLKNQNKSSETISIHFGELSWMFREWSDSQYINFMGDSFIFYVPRSFRNWIPYSDPSSSLFAAEKVSTLNFRFHSRRLDGWIITSNKTKTLKNCSWVALPQRCYSTSSIGWNEKFRKVNVDMKFCHPPASNCAWLGAIRLHSAAKKFRRWMTFTIRKDVKYQKIIFTIEKLSC